LSKTIKELNLTGNNIGDDGVSVVIKALLNKSARKSLHVLSLSNNKISSKGCKEICDFISKCSSLEEL